MLFLLSSQAWSQACHLTPQWQSMEAQTIQLSGKLGVKTIAARIADNRYDRAAGYQWICASAAKDTAVLFVFPQLFSSMFHMRNVFVPLDIYFFDDAGALVDAMVMRPEPPAMELTPRYYRPRAAFRYALEIARPPNHDLRSTPTPLQLMVDTLPQ